MSVKAYWCAKCLAIVDVVAFDSGCASNGGGTHTRLDHGIRIERVAADLPSNRRAKSMKKKRGNSH